VSDRPNIFERAKARADADAPAPAGTPIAAALTALGFGLFVIAAFFALRWLGSAEWVAWIGAACIYGLIAYGDCLLGWRRHRAEYAEALADLKSQAPPQSLH